VGTLRLALPGRHTVLNGLAALAAADELGAPLETTLAALAGYTRAAPPLPRGAPPAPGGGGGRACRPGAGPGPAARSRSSTTTPTIRRRSARRWPPPASGPPAGWS